MQPTGRVELTGQPESAQNPEPAQISGSKNRWLYGSGLFTLIALLVWLIPGAIGNPPGWEPYVLGLPLAVVALAQMSGQRVWTDQEIRMVTFVVCVSTLIHLSFSGGWLTPGTSNIFFVLAAVGLRFSNRDASHRMPIGNRWQNDRYQHWMSVPICLVLLTAFLFLVWWPITQVQGLKIRAMQSRLGLSVETVREMQEIDPFDPTPFQWQTQIELNDLLRNRGVGDLVRVNRYEQSRDMWLMKEPANWMAWNAAGEQGMTLAGVFGERLPDAQTSAVELFEAALERHPTSVSLLLQTALANHLASNPERAKELVDAAWDIDSTTPHNDRRLWCQFIYWPNDLQAAAGMPELAPWAAKSKDLSLPSGIVRAEPLAVEMRRHYDSQ